MNSDPMNRFDESSNIFYGYFKIFMLFRESFKDKKVSTYL